MFMAELFRIAQNGNNPNVTHDEWTNKIQYISAMEYLLSVKRNEILTYATTGMNLEIIMKGKKARQKRSHIVRFHLHEIFRTGKSTETGSRLLVARK
jgi:hypothetical protein